MTELKPCPFCEARAELIIIDTDIRKSVYFVRCSEPMCCARITRKWASKDTAIYAWNKRSKF